MSTEKRFECVTGDGSEVWADHVDPRDVRAHPGAHAWVTIDGEEGITSVLLSSADALALGAHLIELAGEEGASDKAAPGVSGATRAKVASLAAKAGTRALVDPGASTEGFDVVEPAEDGPSKLDRRIGDLIVGVKASAPAPEAHEVDPRWQPGAVWELRGCGRLEVKTATPDADFATLVRDGGARFVVRRADMTEANGWRFVGPAERKAASGDAEEPGCGGPREACGEPGCDECDAFEPLFQHTPPPVWRKALLKLAEGWEAAAATHEDLCDNNSASGFNAAAEDLRCLLRKYSAATEEKPGPASAGGDP